MKKEFSISNDKVLMNFSARYCNNFESLLENIILQIFNKFIKYYGFTKNKRGYHSSI